MACSWCTPKMCILSATENPRAFAASSCPLELPSLNKHSNGDSSLSSQMIFPLQFFLANSAKLKAPYTFCSALPAFIIEIRSHTRDIVFGANGGNFPECTMQSSPLAEIFRSHWTSPVELSRCWFTFPESKAFVCYAWASHSACISSQDWVLSFLNFQCNLSGQAC